MEIPVPTVSRIPDKCRLSELIPHGSFSDCSDCGQSPEFDRLFTVVNRWAMEILYFSFPDRVYPPSSTIV